MLQRMFDELVQFVANDVPFFKDERDQRIQRLTELMASVDASPSEKFRRLVEAYQIEMEYGRTMSAYRQTLADGREAEMVRLGRVALMYRVIEGGETGYWDKDSKQFVADSRFGVADRGSTEHRKRGESARPHHRAGASSARRPVVSVAFSKCRQRLAGVLAVASFLTAAPVVAQQPAAHRAPPAQPAAAAGANAGTGPARRASAVGAAAARSGAPARAGARAAFPRRDATHGARSARGHATPQRRRSAQQRARSAMERKRAAHRRDAIALDASGRATSASCSASRARLPATRPRCCRSRC